jgi:DNA-binding transcriptional LysR family regulator
MPLPGYACDVGALELFVSVVHLGSVGRAARHHGISQPSASSRIGHLEHQLGVTLLERGPTGSVPTDNGTLIAEWAATVIASADALAVGVESLRANQAKRVRIMSSFTVAEYLLPTWLSRFQRSTPGHNTELLVANSTAVISSLRAGSVDLGFVESAELVHDLGSANVGADELAVVVAPGHPWARRKTPLAPEDLLAIAFVMREAGSGTRDTFERAMVGATGDTPVAVLELGSTAAVKAAVMGGSGPAVLSELAVKHEIAAGQLVAVRVEGLALKRVLRMLWPTDRPMATTASLLREQLLT